MMFITMVPSYRQTNCGSRIWPPSVVVARWSRVSRTKGVGCFTMVRCHNFMLQMHLTLQTVNHARPGDQASTVHTPSFGPRRPLTPGQTRTRKSRILTSTLYCGDPHIFLKSPPPQHLATPTERYSTWLEGASFAASMYFSPSFTICAACYSKPWSGGSR
jgi:hypothetical protein